MGHSFIEEIIVCPECKKKLEVSGTKLNCGKCGRSYAFSDGIYSLIEEDLTDFDSEQRDVFDKVSAGYDEYLNNQPLYVIIRDEYVLPYWMENALAGKTILDIGSGTGWATSKISLEAKALVSLDISRGNLVFARKRLCSDRSAFVHGNMKKLPFADKTFDVVTCFWAMHHVEDVRVVVAEIRRVLRDGGVFLGIEPNVRYTWVEFWSDLLHLPRPVRGIIIKAHKDAQKHTHKRLEKEEYYMKGIELKHDHHAGLNDIHRYQNIFSEMQFDFAFKPVGLEIVPPRFYMLKKARLVAMIMRWSDRCRDIFKKGDKAFFNVLKAVKR